MLTTIFDIDGTLADISHRVKYIQREKKDWNKFYSEMNKDKPIEPIVRVYLSRICMARPSDRVICITGRPEKYRELTLKWFEDNDLTPPDELYMRPDGDYSPDTELKSRIVDELEKKGYEFDLAFEDRKRVVDMYRARGIMCCQVAEGDY